MKLPSQLYKPETASGTPTAAAVPSVATNTSPKEATGVTNAPRALPLQQAQFQQMQLQHAQLQHLQQVDNRLVWETKAERKMIELEEDQH